MTTLLHEDLLIECDSSTQSKDSHSNKPGDFHFPLRLRYELGNVPYEVACCDIMFPTTWYNLKEDAVFTWGVPINDQSFTDNMSYTGKLVAGLYADVIELCSALNSAIEASITDPIQKSNSIAGKFNYNHHINKVAWVPSSNLPITSIKLPSSLSKLIGYYHPNKIEHCDISNDLHIMYIHLDLVTPQIVGNRTEQVVQVLHLPSELTFGKIQKITFVPRKYIPVGLNEFQMIKISIKDGQNQVINFKQGSIKLWLHFRPKRFGQV